MYWLSRRCHWAFGAFNSQAFFSPAADRAKLFQNQFEQEQFRVRVLFAVHELCQFPLFVLDVVLDTLQSPAQHTSSTTHVLRHKGDFAGARAQSGDQLAISPIYVRTL